jgi:hypothetical protein
MSYINPDAELLHYLNSLSKKEFKLELIRANEVIKQAEINYEKRQQEIKNENKFSSIFSFLWGDY